MKMADAVPPLEEDNGKDDAANQKSLREQLSDHGAGRDTTPSRLTDATRPASHSQGEQARGAANARACAVHAKHCRECGQRT